MSIPEFDFSYQRFLDRTTVLYGESDTGKSFAIVDILHALKPHVEQIVVISPTDRQNHTYDRGIVPLPYIHYNITPKLLDDIWERQNALAAVYSRASNITVVKKLYDKVQSGNTKEAIDNIARKLRAYEAEIKESEANETLVKHKISNMKLECDKLTSLIYKHHINENRAKMAKMTLTDDEQFTLKYLNLNPRLVIIFDDCTDLLKKYKSHPVIQKLFYQGRWGFITALIACHTDKALDAELRKSAYVNLYTAEKSAHAYFKRGSNDFDPDDQRTACNASKAAFTPLAPNQKLVWVRLENKFYRYTATPHDSFEFGSYYIRDYGKKIQAEAGSLISSNRFIANF